jgi:F420-0:gamma-glutamyl ligase
MKNKIIRRVLIGAAIPLAVLLSASSCASATQDRSGGAGKAPDAFGEATKVTVFTNADSVPNLALMCIDPGDGSGPMAIMSTLSGGDSGKDKAATIVRMPDLDVSYCKGKPR